jgi:hypothetical protein
MSSSTEPVAHGRRAYMIMRLNAFWAVMGVNRQIAVYLYQILARVSSLKSNDTVLLTGNESAINSRQIGMAHRLTLTYHIAFLFPFFEPGAISYAFGSGSFSNSWMTPPSPRLLSPSPPRKACP